MKRTQIIEATAQDLRWAIPDDDDFKYITEAYVDYYTNGIDCAPDHTPEGITHAAAFVYGDVGTVLKYMIIAATLGWKDLISKLKPICDQVGWRPGDLKTTIQKIKTVANILEELYDKYCEPALTTVKAILMGQPADSAVASSNTNFNIKNCVESLREAVVEENIEKHEDLNAALFNADAKLKPEVKNKINEIVAEFLKDFDEAGVQLDIQDVILTGSNASYNYTKDSDLDIHIVADTSKIEDTVDLHKVIYDAYKSSFNKKFDIELNKVPVELYVETQETPLVSNGIYSVPNDTWVKEPTKESIPEVDQEAIDKAFKPWEKRYKVLVDKITDETNDESEIDEFIDKLYELRHRGLTAAGEYSIENLVFKEMRNKGYLDHLKELRHQVISQRLSLTEQYKILSEKERHDYYYKISQLTHYPPIIQPNGIFEIYNVKEIDLAVVLSNLRRQNEVEYVQKSAEKLDFSKLNSWGIPSKLYKLIGKIKL